ncbi:HlyD family secretion protein [Bdellovibrio sp. 22V]|uniref:HlyD family secretion protein n=1 Tax=Bdellovibrio TaxID=958 RepID=UPI002543EB86|nr:HlyD family secretion protein [Bdellovibrio sp. 22V]WII70948.1 HlyD family secretion protein [Bdellovibrio sp. 22V]
MDKKKKILSGVGGVAVLVALYFLYEHVMYVTTDNAQVEAHSVMIAAKVGGYVKAVHVTEGSRVKKGDVMIEIDDRDYQNTLRQAKGELLSLEARKRDLEKNQKRIAELFSKGVVSQQQYDGASTALAEARAKYEALAAHVSQAELNFENTKVVAPSDGFIAKKAAEVGQLASPGVPLLGFVDAGERWVTANFKETEIESIQPGKRVYIDVDAISGKSFEGVVESISSATGATFTLLPPDNATGNFTKVVQRVPVKIKFENISANEVEILKAGLSAFVKVQKH